MAVGTLRREIPALAHWTYLNCGGMAPLPDCVTAELLRIPQEVARSGPLGLQHHEEELVRANATHAMVARLLGAEPDEIALTLQFSTGVNIVVEGLSWRPGDEIIVTDQEHPALLTPIVNMARRRGLTIRRLPVHDQPDAILAALESLLTERTRLLAISHVTTETGTRLPAAEIVRTAHAQGALVLFDGAQSVGQFPVDVRALDCDFYAITGYKWTLGPYPSAALYVRRSVLDQVDVTWTGSRATTSGSVDMDSVVFVPGAARFEYGGRPFIYDSGMASAIERTLALGFPAIEENARELAASLRDRLDRIPGTRLLSPADPAMQTGIQTIALDGLAGTDVAAALRERWSIVTRAAVHGTGVRISLAAFTDESDLDRLEQALSTIVAGR